MWIVEEGLKAPIPKEWEMFTDSQGNVMYRNLQTN